MSNPPSQSPFTFATFFPLGVPLPATPWHLPGPYTQPQRPPPLPTPPKKNPLFEAVKNKDTEELKRLLEAGFRPDEKEGEFDSPFRDAITAGYAEGVKLMSEYMDDIPFDTLLAISDDKLDPKERKAEMLSLLIQLGARFDRSTWRTTALHNLMHVSPDVVRIILDAYPELVNNGGAADYSALSYSLSHFWGGERDFHGLKEIISLLLDRGANPNPVSRKKGFHPINLLLDCDWEECRSGGRQFQEDILKKMLECGSQLPWLEKFTDGEQQHALGLLSKVHLGPIKLEMTVLLHAAREKNPESPFHRDVFPLDLLRVIINFVSDAYERDLRVETGVIQDSTDQIPDSPDNPVKKMKLEIQE